MKRLLSTLALLMFAASVEPANLFVWDGTAGSGCTLGECWENAYTTLNVDFGTHSGFTPGTDFVYVHEGHSPTTSSDIIVIGTATSGSPTRIICVEGNTTGTTPGALCDGSPAYPDERTSGTANGINFYEHLYIYGVEFYSADFMQWGSSTNYSVTIEQSRIELLSNLGGDDFIVGFSGSAFIANKVSFVDVVFDAVNSGSQFLLQAGQISWSGGSVDWNPTNLFNVSTSRTTFTGYNLDLTTFTGALFAVSGSDFFEGELSRVKLGTGASLAGAAVPSPGVRLELFNGEIGTLTNPSLAYEGADYSGTWTLDTARYVTTDPGAASDGTQNYSLSLSTETANRTFVSFYRPLKVKLVDFYFSGDGTNHTLRFYLASGGVLDNTEAWVGCSIFDSTAKTSLGEWVTSRAAPLATGTTLTADPDGDTWTGTDESDERIIDLTFASDDKGVASCWAFVGKDNDRVSFSPAPELDPS